MGGIEAIKVAMGLTGLFRFFIKAREGKKEEGVQKVGKYQAQVT